MSTDTHAVPDAVHSDDIVGRVDTLARLLAADAVEAANSGHPGTAISLAPVANILFRDRIRHDPADSQWLGRDRFVLSCGHASILLYVQLFLSGYDVTLDDLRAFRTLGSRTPGHPEYRHTDGVETTTGPLGQGLATAVGMAMGFVHERAVFDPDAAEGESPFDRRVWVIVSDGDLQEGLSYEAGALAGRMGLDNLTVIYDDNDIQIEGDTRLSSAEDTAARFRAQGWHVDQVGLAHDGDVDTAGLGEILSSPGPHGRPRIVILKSQIAFPSPTAVGTAGSHGAPLGTDEVAGLRKALGVHTEPFTIDEDALAHARRSVADRARLVRTEWQERYDRWQSEDPGRAARHTVFLERRPLAEGVALPRFDAGSSVSTRDASGAAIQAIAAADPALWGGSADLAEPNRTAIAGGGSFLPPSSGLGDYTGRNVHWGVREHGMAAAMNGIALSGGWRVFAGTFLTFSDYQRPSIRLAALMQTPVTFIWSHDSIALGQDGPTHQPVEHLAALRAIPGFTVVRPADGNETVAAWREIIRRSEPIGLVLGRQNVPVLNLPLEAVQEGVGRGGYVARTDDIVDVVVVASGSEVALALSAASAVSEEGTHVRVVSMPSREWFAVQSAEYRDSVLPPESTARVVVEAGSSFGWHDIAGPAGIVLGVDEFGLSAPADQALAARGMTVQHVVDAIRRVALPR